jgi:hypothetical protein
MLRLYIMGRYRGTREPPMELMSKSDIFCMYKRRNFTQFTPFPPPFASPVSLSPFFYCRASFLLLCCEQKFGQLVVIEMKKEGKTTMSTQRNTNQINNASYRVLAMLVGMIIGLAMDNIPVGLILGLSIGVALDKRYE